MKKKLLGLSLACILGSSLFIGCESTDTVQRRDQEILLQESNSQTGMPDLSNFAEKKQLKRILELRDDPKLITYTYTQNVNGKYIYVGKTYGFGIPYATQYTNPTKDVGNGAVINNADPNGLFSPSSADATWIMMVGANGEPEVRYEEEKITVTQTQMRRSMVESFSLEGVEYPNN